MTGKKISLKYTGTIGLGTFVLVCVLNYKILRLEKTLSMGKDEPIELQVQDGIMNSGGNPTKIVFWIPPKFYVRQGEIESRIARQNHAVDVINEGQNNICRDTDLPEFADMASCQFSLANGTVTDADAVILWMFNRGLNVTELPPTNSSGHPRIAFIREPPPLSYWKNPLKGHVNWTMSYRRDSDIWTPYAKTVKLAKPLKEVTVGNISLDKWISGKTKLISGVISHCHTASKRELLIKEMNSTGIADVDIFGGCGKPFKCGRYANNCDSSWEQFGTEYKFFLAFENSLCEDYITEKLWRTLELGMVPVVYGGGKYERDLPPKSFINVMDFNSTLSLMTYLKFVGDNKTEYAKYFEWKKTHKVVDNVMLQWCSLCKEVNTFLNFARTKVYDNLSDWWQHKSSNISVPVCSKPDNTLFSS